MQFNKYARTQTQIYTRKKSGAGKETLTGMGTGVEAEERMQDVNGDESGDGAGMGTEAETRAVVEMNEDGIGIGVGEGGGEGKKREKPHNSCGRDQALSFRTRHHICRQGVAITGIRQLRSQGLVPVHVHRTEGVTRSEGREGSNGVGNGDGAGA